MDGLGVTFVSVWHSYFSQILAFRYFIQLVVRYCLNVRRDERNRSNRIKVAISTA